MSIINTLRFFRDNIAKAELTNNYWTRTDVLKNEYRLPYLTPCPTGLKNITNVFSSALLFRQRILAC